MRLMLQNNICHKGPAGNRHNFPQNIRRLCIQIKQRICGFSFKVCYLQTVILSLLLLCGGVVCSGCKNKEPLTRTGFYFDTIISVTLYDSSKTSELDHCFELAKLYESYFSATIADSDISRINASPGKPVRVHDETIRLLEKGIYYAKLSGGKFDITIGKLTKLWDFQADDPVIPDKKKIKKAAAAVGYSNIRIKGNDVTLEHTAAAIDVGGIAKGYIADEMKKYLVSCGIKSGLINLGGNVLTIGAKEDGGAYAIGIQKPFDDTGAMIAVAEVKDQTVVTSGTYERCFIQDGKVWHHILDVSTGYPVENDLLAVSVICENSADGDALSTACFVLGLEKGMELIESLEHTEAIFITSDYRLHGSSGIGSTVPVREQ